MKIKMIFLTILLVMINMHSVSCDSTSEAELERQESMRAWMEEIRLESEGYDLERQFRYAEALKKYEKALELDKYQDERLQGAPLAYISSLLHKQGKYEQALEKIKILCSMAPDEKFQIKAKELEALVQYQKTGDPKRVYEYIEYFKEKQKRFLPPEAGDPSEATTILRLYDTIGDYDAGIQFIDMVINWFYDKSHEFRNVKRVTSSQEAAEFMEENLPEKQRKPGWKAYLFMRDCYLIREAFEQDKRDGAKGRATQALIQSDYFPW